ncbi:MAG: primosomal protein N' [Treponema sp.]|jgi:primosomal protein N' (replication factor Y)|nr:primosomal protein N' [Treponema sp.]
MRYFEIVFNKPIETVFTYAGDAERQAAVGKRAKVSFGNSMETGFIVGEKDALPPDLPPEKLKSIIRVLDPTPIFDEKEIELAHWVAEYYLCGFGESLAAILPSGKKTKSMPSFSDAEMDEAVPVLSVEQLAALSAIFADEEPNAAGLKKPMTYLFGITGSGKTEVFLRAAEETIRRGKSVIYLVPEISLTMQTVEVIGRRFGNVASTLHSGMAPGQRLNEWIRIRNGEVRIVVGPRSAVFAPVRNLGLIIIDEEHDGSYKSSSTPRYHARQAAMHRCAVDGARLLMGSATPSIEAWRLMTEPANLLPILSSGGPSYFSHHIKKLNLTQRLSGGGIPEIRIVNLKGTDGCLTRELRDEIRKTVAMGRQAILFLNHRGFAYFYHCPECGFELVCRNCSVSLTYHKAQDRAICHYCGYSETPPRVCPKCGSLDAGYAGFGTESIEDEVKRIFPDLRVRRVDADATESGEALKETLDAFRKGEFDLLLGTQMVAKGLNFPGVRLVGVVLADTGLHLPDFRASERTFSLIVQVAGRSGRFFPDGKVIVQTLRPFDPAIERACALDVEGFFDAELKQRAILNFPPFSRLIRFTVRSRDKERSAGAIGRLASLVLSFLPTDADALGPAECPIGLIAGNYRYQLILRGKTMSTLHGAARSALAVYNHGKDAHCYVEVDVDPVSLI